MNLSIREAGEKLEQKLGNKYALVLLGIIGFSAAIRFKYAFFEGMWVDEGRYSVIATSMANNLEFFLTYSTGQQAYGTVTSYPPLYPYLLSSSVATIGRIIGAEAALRIVSPLASLVGIFATYLIGSTSNHKETGLAAALIISVNPIFLFLSERILIGATLTTLFTISILLTYYGLEDESYSKYAIWMLGPSVTLTVLAKQPGYLLGPIVFFYFVFKKRDEIKQLIMTETGFRESKFYKNTLTNKDYYIGVSLGLLVLLPMAARNISTCGFPLCTFQEAVKNLTADASQKIDVRGLFYYLRSLPSVLTVPIFGLTIFQSLKYLYTNFNTNKDLLVKKLALILFILAGAYLFALNALPLVILASVAFIADTDIEKLLWTSIALGIGFMSFNATKVPRYIVFTFPLFGLVSAISLNQLSRFIAEKIDFQHTNFQLILAILLIPVILFSFADAESRISSHSFKSLEPAGEWIKQNTAENTTIAASSRQQIQFFSGLRNVTGVGNNESELTKKAKEGQFDLLVLDIYERTQPRWIQTAYPPYRLERSLISEIRSGTVSPQGVVERYGRPPSYLVPVKSFGSSGIPLTNQEQSKVVIYRVNKSAIK
jgi:hypothetical protein